MVKQKKNNDINATVLAKESSASIDKIDKVMIEQPPSASPEKVIEVKAPLPSTITKTKKLSLDSVDENLKVNAAKSPTNAGLVIAKEPIDIERTLFEEKWLSFIQVIKTEHENAGLAMSLEQTTFQINNNRVEFLVNSQTTKELIEKELQHLIEYLSKALENDTISVHIKVSEQAFEMNKKSLSPNDKLKLMADSNPAVVELIKAMNLEIDY